MDNIIVHRVYDKEGSFSHLELHQGGNVLLLSLADAKLDIQTHNYKWPVLKKMVDSIKEEISPTVEIGERADG